jgi:hypothetical protein
MMRIIQNLRIGTKLAIASALGILLVGLMIFSQMAGNATVRKANEGTVAQQTVARDAIDAKASVRGMQVSTRDVRLASTPADLQKASDSLAARLKSVDGFVGEMLKSVRSAESRERIEKLRVAGDFAKGAQQIAALRTEVLGMEAKRSAGSELPAEAVAKIAKLNDELASIVRDVTLPLAAQIESLADKIVDHAKHVVEQEIAAAAQ